MATTSDPSASFEETDTRNAEMHSTIENWIDDLVADVDEAKVSEEFQEWLDIQSQFHDYSHRNTLLITLQCPQATKIAGYNTWRNEFDRHVQEGEDAIWIWAPIITKQCPECENSQSYHEQSDCEYDETPPDEWSNGLVGFKPTSVFDVSQTEGEPLPELETEATGMPKTWFPCSSARRTISMSRFRSSTLPTGEHGSAKGVCKYRSKRDLHPVVEAKARPNQADLAVTLIHEYAHALLHSDVDDATERSKREVEAEAVAYIVGRYFDLDTSGSAFYLAAWQGDDAEGIQERLGRISSTAQKIIDTVAEG